MNLTKRSTTELPPTVKHSAEAATFMVVGGKSMRNPHESERTSLAENAAPEQSHSRQTSRERPVSQPIGPSESLPQPGSFEAPKRTPFAGVDRTFKANLARLTQGITPAGLALAYFDWLTHLMLAPGKQLQLVEKAGRKAARLSMYAACSAADPKTPPCIDGIAASDCLERAGAANAVMGRRFQAKSMPWGSVLAAPLDAKTYAPGPQLSCGPSISFNAASMCRQVLASSFFPSFSKVEAL
jgi:hypothetical protein